MSAANDMTGWQSCRKKGANDLALFKQSNASWVSAFSDALEATTGNYPFFVGINPVHSETLCLEQKLI